MFCSAHVYVTTPMSHNFDVTCMVATPPARIIVEICSQKSPMYIKMGK